jgi:hypothetical protein
MGVKGAAKTRRGLSKVSPTLGLIFPVLCGRAWKTRQGILTGGSSWVFFDQVGRVGPKPGVGSIALNGEIAAVPMLSVHCRELDALDVSPGAMAYGGYEHPAVIVLSFLHPSRVREELRALTQVTTALRPEALPYRPGFGVFDPPPAAFSPDGGIHVSDRIHT